jgi:hypothetical protein
MKMRLLMISIAISIVYGYAISASGYEESLNERIVRLEQKVHCNFEEKKSVTGVTGLPSQEKIQSALGRGTLEIGIDVPVFEKGIRRSYVYNDGTERLSIEFFVGSTCTRDAIDMLFLRLADCTLSDEVLLNQNELIVDGPGDQAFGSPQKKGIPVTNLAFIRNNIAVLLYAEQGQTDLMPIGKEIDMLIQNTVTMTIHQMTNSQLSSVPAITGTSNISMPNAPDMQLPDTLDTLVVIGVIKQELVAKGSKSLLRSAAEKEGKNDSTETLFISESGKTIVYYYDNGLVKIVPGTTEGTDRIGAVCYNKTTLLSTWKVKPLVVHKSH